MDEPPTSPDRWLNAPNALGLLRALLALSLPPLAWHEFRVAFVVVFALATATDWIDGHIARRLGQRTRIGPVIDSLADALLYVMLGIGVLLLRPETIAGLWPWLAAAGGAYAVNLAAAVIKFQRMPAYHTRLAKLCWGLVSLAALVLVLGGPTWPAIIAAVLLLITNAEELAITLTLRQWRTDVPTWLKLR
jgi:phosphatidylglycerophosphate synthase